MSTISSFRRIENKHDVYRSQDSMKKFCEVLRQNRRENSSSMKIIYFFLKKKKLSIKEYQKSYENAKFCYICNEKFENKYLKDKKYCKFRDHSHYTGEYRDTAHSICVLKYCVPKKIPIVFRNRSNYDYHFIIIKLAEKFKKQFTCLGESTEKYITFTVPIE